MMPPSTDHVSGGEASRESAASRLSLRGAVRETFLGRLPGETVDHILRHAALRTSERHATLFRAGERASALLLLLEGSIELYGVGAERREVTLDVVRPVDLVAPWSPLLDVPYAVSARTVQRSRLLALDLDDLGQAIMRDAALARMLLRQLCLQASALTAQLEDLKLRSATERVACYLLDLAPAREARFEIELPLRKQLIASKLGMTPESLSRAFAALKVMGVTVSGNRVGVHDVARLKRFCRAGE